MKLAAEAVETSSPAYEERNRYTGSNERLWIIAAGAIVVIQLWFGLIGTSFWLDETGTWWIVKDGAAEAVRRAFSWSGQSPLFYLIEWLSSRLFGLNEVALRIPSMLAMSGAVWFLYRIAERLYDRAGAAVVAFVFLCAASFYAIDARPYALAILCLTASTWALLRWLEGSRPLDAVLYVIAAALVVYAHCVLSLGLAAGVIYGVAVTRQDQRRLAHLGLMVVAFALLSAPLLSQLGTFYAARSVHTFTGAPAYDDLLPALIPCSLAGACILLVWIYMGFRGDGRIVASDASRHHNMAKCTPNTLLLVGTWSLLVPLVLFLLAVLTDLRLYVDRYYSSALAGQALLAGGLLSSIRRSEVRKGLIVLVGALSIVAQGKLTVSSHGNDDWRDAMAFVNREAGSAPVLLVSPFAEGTDFKAIGDPRLREILFAPERMYGEPARSIRLPHIFPASETAELETVTEQLRSERRFYLVNNKPDRSYELWLLGRFGSRCKSETTGARFGYVWIARFTCGA